MSTRDLGTCSTSYCINSMSGLGFDRRKTDLVRRKTVSINNIDDGKGQSGNISNSIQCKLIKLNKQNYIPRKLKKNPLSMLVIL